ncbi:MAG: hypothetical protein BGO21_14475 [Dyadobacter sp. 50-39]|uniref:DUF433 domain-containing protein n=1 Tax=Dyadobacter sp. 50-39 TaxID=1895756 RepID=UPI000959B11D|nr:DUF433 domain-containing protein [Dyadobacter sp. 50-39]OJV18021.1 MAG: hypothetical protein BGO21_14475 [Dyadobacter sp. 50-39]
MHDSQQRIDINLQIRFGKPCVRGTRITVTDISSRMECGMTVEQIIRDFPPLQHEDIVAALEFCSKIEP